YRWNRGETRKVLKKSGVADSRLWQRECHHVVALLRSKLAVSTRANHNILLAVKHVGHRRGLGAGRQFEAPQLLSCFGIERSHEVVHGRGGKHQAACRSHGSSEVDGAGALARNEASQRHFPRLLSRKEIDGRHSAPGRGIARHLARGEQECPIYSKRSRILIAKLAVDSVVLIFVGLRFIVSAWNELYPCDKSIRIDEH